MELGRFIALALALTCGRLGFFLGFEYSLSYTLESASSVMIRFGPTKTPVRGWNDFQGERERDLVFLCGVKDLSPSIFKSQPAHQTVI